MVRQPFRRQMLGIHRWLSLAVAVFWLLQAATGILIVFHWEISDRSISTHHRPTDLAAIERRIDQLVASGGKINAIWTTAGLPDRYDIYFEEGGRSASVRILGDGSVIDRPHDNELRPMAFLVGFHHDLLGSWGSWIVSLSGLLLCSNLLLGLYAAWPKPGTWRKALVPPRRGPSPARLYAWHRAVGLWAVIPALAIAATGTMLKFEKGLGSLIGAEKVSVAPNPPDGAAIGFASAARTALQAIPGSSLTQVAWPTGDDATYRVRMRAPAEIRRAYGGSFVFVDANDGSIRGVFPISKASAAQTFMNALVPVHTGEAGGLGGRVLLVAIGFWLITMIVAGLLLWLKRRPRKHAG